MRCPNCNEFLVFPLRYHMCSFLRIKRNKRSMVVIVLLSIALITLIVQTAIRKVDVKPSLKKCHTEAKVETRWLKMVNYFKSKGNKHPEQMATAVLETKRPKLMAAIAGVESGGNVNAYNKKSKAKGAFQIKEKHWGKVPKTAKEQALQSEKILNALIDEKGSLEKGLNAYGGCSTKKYSESVLAELTNINNLDI